SKVIVASYYKKDDERFEFPNVDEFIQNTQWLRRFTLPWFVYQVDLRLFKNKAIQEAIMYCKPCFEAAKEADVCIAVGGDTYCYNKGKEHWPLERKMKKLGKKMMLWGCSIEPEDIPGEMEEHLSNFDVITVRDPISYEALVNSKVTSKIVRCADPAFLLPVQECRLPSGWEDGKMVGLNFSPMVMGDLQEKDSPRKAIYALIDSILANSEDKIALIPHVRLSFSDDMDELRPIYNKYKSSGRVLLIDDDTLNACQLKYIISKCKVFVGARTHATIAAYSTGVPTLSIGYSVKARGIARDLFGSGEGMTVSIKDIGGTDVLTDLYENIYTRREELKEILMNIMPEYKKKALISGQALKKLLQV
ncbi:MAG: polysaccharide pyruvyl transferase family protein, partial [Alphaproteobacteria bacterium]|nr:polysaccharide pyruvyl transferase family protein [Alphaproteobacteria bacterium]